MRGGNSVPVSFLPDDTLLSGHVSIAAIDSSRAGVTGNYEPPSVGIDIRSFEDKQALIGTWSHSPMILFIHGMKNLDVSELNLYCHSMQLRENAWLRAEMVFVSLPLSTVLVHCACHPI